MKMNSIKNILLIAIVSVLLFSCSTTNQYERSQDLSNGLYGNAQTGESSLANESWQNLFNDPILDSLIAEGGEKQPRPSGSCSASYRCRV